MGAAKTDSDSVTMLMCIIQAKKGNFAAAIAIADSFDDPSSPGIRVALLGEIAVMQVTAGDAQGAKRTLEAAREAALGADKAQWRAMTLSDVAAAQAKAGNPQGAAQAFAEALEINRMVDSDLFLQTSRAYIAERQAEAGFFLGRGENRTPHHRTRRRRHANPHRSTDVCSVSPVGKASATLVGSKKTPLMPTPMCCLRTPELRWKQGPVSAR